MRNPTCPSCFTPMQPLKLSLGERAYLRKKWRCDQCMIVSCITKGDSHTQRKRKNSNERQKPKS